MSGTLPFDMQDAFNTAQNDDQDKAAPANMNEQNASSPPTTSFASLTPVGDVTRHEFAQVIARMRQQPTWAPNAQRFVAPTQDKYLLSLDVHPQDPAKGWVLGADPATVDILLIDRESETSHRQHVGSQHCNFSFVQSSPFLMLSTGQKKHVIVDGQLEIDSGVYAIGSSSSTGICIAHLHYILELTISAADKDDFVTALQQFRKARGWQDPDIPHILSRCTPLDMSLVIQGRFHVMDPTAQGTFGKVSFGVRASDGKGVAAKRVSLQSLQLAKLADNEIRSLQALRNDRIVRLAHDFLAPNAMDEHEHGKLDLTLILEPAMHYTLPAATQNLTDFQKLLLASDIFTGLAYMHGEGFMHRDIKPSNIGVSFGGRAVLLDLGCCTQDTESTDHHKGTIRYLAPEVLALKYGDSQVPYTHEVDVFAAGICIIECLLVPGGKTASSVWRWPDRIDSNYEQYVGIRAGLMGLFGEKTIRGKLAATAHFATTWKVGDRTSSSNAMEVLKAAVKEFGPADALQSGRKSVLEPEEREEEDKEGARKRARYGK